MAVRGADGQAAAELVHVQGYLCLGRPLDGVTVGDQPAAAEGLVEHGEGAAQLGAGGALVEVRPEHGGQGVAAVAAAGEGQVGQQGHGLVPAQFHRLTVELDERRAQ